MTEPAPLRGQESFLDALATDPVFRLRKPESAVKVARAVFGDRNARRALHRMEAMARAQGVPGVRDVPIWSASSTRRKI